MSLRQGLLCKTRSAEIIQKPATQLEDICVQVPGGAADALAFLADVASKGEEASNDRVKVRNRLSCRC